MPNWHARLQGKQNRAQFTNWLCHEVSGVCKSKPPPLPKDRKHGPAFEVMDPKEAEMEKMLAGMKACLSSSSERACALPSSCDPVPGVCLEVLFLLPAMQ